LTVLQVFLPRLQQQKTPGLPHRLWLLLLMHL
jgi:hypothetical protein